MDNKVNSRLNRLNCWLNQWLTVSNDVTIALCFLKRTSTSDTKKCRKRTDPHLLPAVAVLPQFNHSMICYSSLIIGLDFINQ